MLRVIYRREFHIYLTALYALRRAKPILTRLVPPPPTGGPRCVCLLRTIQYTINSHRLHPRKKDVGRSRH